MNQITAAKLIDILQKQAKTHNLSLDELKVDFRFNHRNDWAFNMEELSFDYCGGSLTIDIEPEDTEDYLPDNMAMNNVTLNNCELLDVAFEEILNENKEVLIRLKNI